MNPLPPKVSLVTHTANPVEAIFNIWESSRHNGCVLDTATVAARRHLAGVDQEMLAISARHSKTCQCSACQHTANWGDAEFTKARDNYAFCDNVYSTFKKVIDAKIPVAENVSFTFLLENVSIAFREQMVRHRIGVKVGDRLGVDIAPDLADSTFWAQSMRILDMGKFYDEGRYEIPETIKAKGDLALQLYREQMEAAEDAYGALVGLGVPMEDARMVIPLAATSRITWTLNLAALQHIIGKRGCWILQLGFWGPIIKGMVEELATKVDPYFRNLIAPPCISGDKFKACLFKLDNERRIDGEDEIPPCPLFLHNHPVEAKAAAVKAPAPRWVPITIDGKDARSYEGGVAGWLSKDDKSTARFLRMEVEYKDLWKRNPHTGAPLNEAANTTRP